MRTRDALHARGDVDTARFAGDVRALANPAQAVGFYLPIRSEIDPLPLMHALHGGFRIVVPAVTGAAAPLAWHEWTPETPCQKGAFGIDEPLSPRAAAPDIIFAPLLAFDMHATRLGYGGGFYDRTVAAIRREKPLLYYGLAYAGQVTKTLPVGVYDIPLDGVLTENGVEKLPTQTRKTT